jgi:hypothetical protein
MGGPILCDCGAVLLDAVSDEGVTPIGGEPITFRRDTDYVVCASCHKVYKARSLLDGRSLSESLVDRTTTTVQEEDEIASLERLLEDRD